MGRGGGDPDPGHAWELRHVGVEAGERECGRGWACLAGEGGGAEGQRIVAGSGAVSTPAGRRPPGPPPAPAPARTALTTASWLNTRKSFLLAKTAWSYFIIVVARIPRLLDKRRGQWCPWIRKGRAVWRSDCGVATGPLELWCGETAQPEGPHLTSSSNVKINML